MPEADKEVFITNENYCQNYGSVQPVSYTHLPKLEKVEKPKGIPPSIPTYQPC